jgi:uncharacterized repeat protein (TIGR01451 family)
VDIIPKSKPRADLSAALSCPAKLKIGKTATCALKITNNGPAAASAVTSVVTLPTAMSVVSCGEKCILQSEGVAWTSNSLAAGVSVTYTVTVKASEAGSAQITAAVGSPNPDPDMANNRSVANLTIT